MFTGIVTDVGEVLAVEPKDDHLRRIKIACSYQRQSIADGASIACAGVCLTVTGTGTEAGRTWFTADAGAETLKLTTAGQWRAGSRLNLERALKVGDELGGHMVSGHVDGMAEVAGRDDLTDTVRLLLRAPKQLMPLIAVKGSVAVDGVSLTVNSVGAVDFSVLLIPHTLQTTTLGALRKGDRANLEADTMARYAARLAEPH